MNRWSVALLVLAVLLGACRAVRGSADVKTETFSLPVNPEVTVTSQTVDLSAAMSSIHVDALTNPETLFTAAIQYLGTVAFESSVNPETAVRLRETDDGLPYQGDPLRWDVQIPGALPAALSVTTGSGDVGINGGALNLTALSVDTGSGNVTVSTSPNSSEAALSVRTGSGAIDVTVPRDSIARFDQLTSGSGDMALTVQTGGNALGTLAVSSGTLQITAGRGARLNLSRVESSSGDILLTFEGGAWASATVAASSGNIVIDIQDEIPFRLEVQNIGSGVTNLPFDLGRVSGSGDTGVWETPTYANAEQRIHIIVTNVGSGNVTVR